MAFHGGHSLKSVMGQHENSVKDRCAKTKGFIRMMMSVILKCILSHLGEYTDL